MKSHCTVFNVELSWKSPIAISMISVDNSTERLHHCSYARPIQLVLETELNKLSDDLFSHYFTLKFLTKNSIFPCSGIYTCIITNHYCKTKHPFIAEQLTISPFCRPTPLEVLLPLEVLPGRLAPFEPPRYATGFMHHDNITIEV